MIGGDLVRIPIDLKRQQLANAGSDFKYEVVIDLADRADVYILFPDQESPQPWLTRDYELTALRVGIDRGEGSEGETPGTGPGQSIDTTFSVWKSKQPMSGTVTTGGGYIDAAYSIVLMPHGETVR